MIITHHNFQRFFGEYHIGVPAGKKYLVNNYDIILYIYIYIYNDVDYIYSVWYNIVPSKKN